ncbi:unnamed protein product [Owenia fusiformis]|uniref:Bacteriophage T5 Orf172 DNA-binding domain-containing protein n=1 Tax=Owenia fusiformis TaxID=6347 RepID=A0A8J1Y1Y2_OWEFU|nr:unnamed protein product [Owenia fusiformis]
MSKMSVYVIYDLDNNCFKIGKSDDVEGRLSEIREQHPRAVEVMRQTVRTEHASAAESAAHSRVQTRLNMVPICIDPNDSDWFKPSIRGITKRTIEQTIKEAIIQYT